ncbi:acetyl esterase [Amycolatopsis sacchari]|uniref:Acetyl esterase n=1 Tax=Amycolatopsis sacchari TaxID=115433 RepID=A0A1I3WLE8_9PSEU|nr:acetyl esterase [Amycolatopsis sacchari]
MSPLRRNDFRGEPPTFLVSSGLDPFVLQNRRYAAALERAGVPVRYVEYPGLPHGFPASATRYVVSITRSAKPCAGSA